MESCTGVLCSIHAPCNFQLHHDSIRQPVIFMLNAKERPQQNCSIQNLSCVVVFYKAKHFTVDTLQKEDVTIVILHMYVCVIQTRLRREVRSWRSFIPDCICTVSREATTSGWLTSAGELEHLSLSATTL